MHENTKSNVTGAAQYVFALWKQPNRVELERSFVTTAVNLLDQIESEPKTLEELAEALDIHPSTVSEYVNGLKKGGIPIEIGTTRTRGQTTGRQESTYKLRSAK